jgi:biopolymer transport protein TolQ
MQNQVMRERLNKAASPFEFVRRATERAAAVVHGEMQRGLLGLATVATLAPWVGLFGTLVGIASSFSGIGGNKISAMAAIAKCLSDACLPTALGLVVGLMSLLCYRYLTNTLETFDREMDGASLALVNQLSRRGT